MNRIPEERLAEIERYSLEELGTDGVRSLTSALREAYAEIDARQLKLNEVTFRKSAQQVINNIIALADGRLNVSVANIQTRSDIPWLIAEVERLRGLIKGIERSDRACCPWCDEFDSHGRCCPAFTPDGDVK